MSPQQRTKQMRQGLISAALAISLLPIAANAQLTINMNMIKCDQYLAMSPDMSRDFSAWMSGWFSYQTRRTFVDLALHQKNIANVKAWCQYHPQENVMSGLQNAIGSQ
jgi:HdeA/HdeB family protein